ncbi:hypothetical protein OG874_24590 [Nocardia sp. NBC_00565]|uniref:hypothetical protein n=1 Tax=Nocardia sp. NBC_00565 TaxID=2975993 RepID=UPI002E801413|nr:hypothetical protein [Nocardia sp. NBC_00565]WUC00084.1 hypothetical protein OG874_24590 [Nocardia sp. NBC_00565]
MAVAGAIVAIPLTALAVPASADPVGSGPSVTDVRHDRWDCDRPDFFDNWSHSPGRWDDCDRWDNRWDDPWRVPRHLFPRGALGSS